MGGGRKGGNSHQEVPKRSEGDDEEESVRVERRGLPPSSSSPGFKRGIEEEKRK